MQGARAALTEQWGWGDMKKAMILAGLLWLVYAALGLWVDAPVFAAVLVLSRMAAAFDRALLQWAPGWAASRAQHRIRLLMREIDVALTLQRPDHPGLCAQPLAEGVLVALAPLDYWPEPTRGQPLALMELADAPLIGLSSTDPLSARLDSYLKAVEPPPRVSIAVQTYSLARAMVESGAGLAVIDPFTALGAAPDATAIRPLAPPLPITLYAVTRASEPPPHTVSELLTIFSRRAREQLDRVYNT